MKLFTVQAWMPPYACCRTAPRQSRTLVLSSEFRVLSRESDSKLSRASGSKLRTQDSKLQELLLRKNHRYRLTEVISNSKYWRADEKQDRYPVCSDCSFGHSRSCNRAPCVRRRV